MKILASMIAVIVFTAACSSNSNSGPAPDSGTNPGTPVATATNEPPEVSDDLRQEIADTLEGFTEAFLNTDLLKLATYWSEDCAEEDLEAINGAVLLAAGFLGGEVDMSVDADKLIIEELPDGRVRVPETAEQPEGIFEILIDGRPLPNSGGDDEDDVMILVFESGVWRITECAAFASEFDFGD